jgi:thiol-disulfide isomerase/thioredoxin
MRLQIVALLFMATAWIACQEEKPQQIKKGMIGKPMPTFTIQLLDGTSYLHSAEIPGDKNIVLFYFKPTCPFCRAQMRDMVNNMEKFKDEQLYILTNYDLKSAKAFADYFKLNLLKNVIVGRDTGSVVLNTYRLIGLPFTAYFDKNKQLKTAYMGRMSANLLFQF